MVVVELLMLQDVASTGALKPYSVEAKWDQGGIKALSGSRFLLNFYWVLGLAPPKAGSIRIPNPANPPVSCP